MTKDMVELAVREDRIILCFDLDFGDLVALSGKTLPGVVTFRMYSQKSEVVNRRLEECLPEVLPELANGVLVVIEDHRVRIRRLPIQ